MASTLSKIDLISNQITLRIIYEHLYLETIVLNDGILSIYKQSVHLKKYWDISS